MLVVILLVRLCAGLTPDIRARNRSAHPHRGWTGRL